MIGVKMRNEQVVNLIDRGDEGLAYTPSRSTTHCGVLASIEHWISRGVVDKRIAPSFGTNDIDLGPNAVVEILATGGRVSDGDAGAMALAAAGNPDLYSVVAQASENDYSIGIEISFGDFEFFTAGDLTGSEPGKESHTYSRRQFGDTAQIYTNVESHMVRHWKRIGRESDVEVYRVNHHGSGYSSNGDLLGALEPEVAVYSTGGSYGHPDTNTVTRLAGSDQYVTTSVSRGSWPAGFPAQYGTLVGEVQIFVSADGTRYQVGDSVYPSYSNDEEAH
jgi:hypothetical protein